MRVELEKKLDPISESVALIYSVLVFTILDLELGNEVHICNCLLRLGFFHVHKIIFGRCERLMPEFRIEVSANGQRLLTEPTHEVKHVLLGHVFDARLLASLDEPIDASARTYSNRVGYVDFFLGSMVRDHEGYGFRYTELTGVALTIRGKQRKARTVEISSRLASEINERRKRSNSEYLFPNRKGKPNQHLLRDLQDLAKKAGTRFHTELHKLRKTGASRRYLKGAGLPMLMLELGHESLATTQDYLAAVCKEGEAKKAVAEADFVPKPRLSAMEA